MQKGSMGIQLRPLQHIANKWKNIPKKMVLKRGKSNCTRPPLAFRFLRGGQLCYVLMCCHVLSLEYFRMFFKYSWGKKSLPQRETPHPQAESTQPCLETWHYNLLKFCTILCMHMQCHRLHHPSFRKQLPSWTSSERSSWIWRLCHSTAMICKWNLLWFCKCMISAMPGHMIRSESHRCLI